MFNSEKNKNYFLICIFSLFVINGSILLITKDNSWVSDDFIYVFGSKLYNLVQGNNFFFENNEGRLNIGFFFLNQLIPDNYFLWHSFIIGIYFFSGIVFFLVLNRLFEIPIYSLIATLLFTINLSISLKSLTWACFYSHIITLFLGLISLLLLTILINKKKNFLLTSAYLIISILSISISESSLIYFIINLIVFIFFFYKKGKLAYNLKTSLLIVSPIILFFLLNIILYSHPAQVLSERSKLENEKKYEQIFFKKKEDEIYYYRSTYSPRNIKGYTFKLSDNVLNTINLPVLINNYDHFEFLTSQKNKIKSNYLLIVLILFFLILLLLAYLYIFLKKNKKLIDYNFLIFLHISVLLIYTFIYARTDLNLALSLTSAMIIAKIVCDLYEKKKFLLCYFLILSFSVPSILGAFNKFDRYGDFSAKENLKNFSELNEIVKIPFDNIFFSKNEEMKFYYFYKNFDLYDQKLMKGKGINNFSKFQDFIQKSKF